MRIYSEIDKQYILEDIKSYAESEELISDRGMRLVNWNAIYNIYVMRQQWNILNLKI